MAYRHGVYVSEIQTSVQAAPPVDSALPFVVGGAPIVAGPALISSWSQFRDTFIGDNDVDPDSRDYPLCAHAYYWFVLAGRGECVFQSVQSDAAPAAIEAIQSIHTLYERFGRVASLLCVPCLSEDASVCAAMAAAVSNIGGRFKGVALVDVPAGYADPSTAIDAADLSEHKPTTSPFVCLCWPYAGVGEYRFAASSVMCAAINATDGTYGGLPYVSPSNKPIPITGAYREAVVETKKASLVYNGGPSEQTNYLANSSNSPYILKANPTSDSQLPLGGEYRIVEFPSVAVRKLDVVGDTHLCVDAAAIPHGTAITLAYYVPAASEYVEEPVYMTREDVNTYLGAFGLVGLRNTAAGWVEWGDNTAAYPGNTDVKDYMIPIRRMFNHVGNQFQIFADGRIDMPLNVRQLEGVVKAFNQVLSGWVGFGALNAASVALDAERNTPESLLSGTVYLRIKIAPPPAMVVIEGVIEYDVAGFEASLA